ncbi:MAG: hypothetical protein IJQ82_06625 [Selenomonadaceae bacterium]|nr:hypothetical protein [Selenomonadaceae bacterium]
MKLDEVIKLRGEIAACERRLESLREFETAMTSRLDGLPKATARVSKVEKLALQIVESESCLAQLYAEVDEKARELAEEIFRRVDGMSCTVLFKRYVMCKTFAQIASEMNYSEPNIYYWHRQGVKAFGRG